MAYCRLDHVHALLKKAEDRLIKVNVTMLLERFVGELQRDE